MALVGDDKVTGVNVGGVDAGVAEHFGDDHAREAFAVAGDSVDGARGQLAQHRQPADQLGQLLEGLLDLGADRAPLAEVEVLQFEHHVERRVAFPGDGARGNLQQLVGRFAHG